MTTQVFKLGNLCCVICADEVQAALRAETGVASASMNYMADTVSVNYDDTVVNPEDLVLLIESAACGCSKVTAVGLGTSPAPRAAGEEHAPHDAQSATGMKVAHIHHQVQMAPISMGTKMDRMQYEMPATAAEHVHHQIHAQAMAMEHAGHAGMEGMAHMGMDHDMSDPKMARAMEADMRNRFFVALVLTIPTVLYSPLFTRFFNVKLPAPVDPNWIMFVLSTPVVWWAGWIFISGAYTSLRHRALNMSVLIATGVLAA